MGRLRDHRFRHAHPCVPVRSAHYADSAARRFRVLKITTWIAATVSAGFGLWQLLGGYGTWHIGLINVITGLAFLAIPLLRPLPDLVAPMAFVVVAYGSIFFITWNIGTASGLQFYYLTSASVLVLILGIERIALAGVLAGLGAVLVVLLEITRAGMAFDATRFDAATNGLVAGERRGVDVDGPDQSRCAQTDHRPVVALDAAPAGLPAVDDLATRAEGTGNEVHRLGVQQVLLLAERLVAGGHHGATEQACCEVG